VALFEEVPGRHERRLGLGGFHVGKIADADLAVEIVRRAVDSGFVLLDNSWDYLGGESERRVGRALAGGGYRDRVLVMTKADSHSYDGLMRQFSESLERLGLSSVDLLQLHEVIREADAAEAVEGGALRAMADLRDQGAVGHIGVTGHKDPRYLVDLIDRAAADGIRVETAQMPISAVDVHGMSFRRTALPACLERGVLVIGMKPLGGGDFVSGGDLTAPDLLRWALDQPTAVCMTGCETLEQVDQAAEARDSAPLTDGERAGLESLTARLLASGSIAETYKSTRIRDATSRHPEWLV
jgi:aryl-alcohol dehydrogenase-like predicted oxidoreductase